MGDRVLIQIKSAKEFSPVAYGHYSGSTAPDICKRLERRMEGRSNDVPYAFARLMQEMIGDDDGNTGFGCWNAKGVLDASESHGDAGVIVIDVSKPGFTFQCFGGYLVLGKDGYPVSKYEVEHEEKTKGLRESALAKLTPEERAVLGLE